MDGKNYWAKRWDEHQTEWDLGDPHSLLEAVLFGGVDFFGEEETNLGLPKSATMRPLILSRLPMQLPHLR
jgi:hypothetical protein